MQVSVRDNNVDQALRVRTLLFSLTRFRNPRGLLAAGVLFWGAVDGCNVDCIDAAYFCIRLKGRRRGVLPQS